MKRTPLVFVIMDGWGLAPASQGNAITLAKTPNLKKLAKDFSNTQLMAASTAVGLPLGQDGNSEAGHMNIGAGRIVEQDAIRINHCIYNGTFHKNAAILSAITHAERHKSRLHLMGLLTDGMSAHAYPDHLYALLDLLKKKKVAKVYLHLFTDGRDSPQHAALTYLKRLKKYFYNGEIIATIVGRFYAMERNKRWPITEAVYNLLTLGETHHRSESPESAILEAYNRNESDEFIHPTLIDKQGVIKDNDAVIYFNLRSDRTRQLTKAFVQPNFTRLNSGSFNRKKVLKNLEFVTMTDFGPDLDHTISAFPATDIVDTLPMLLTGKKQLYIAESEKYAHVTYFFNGGYANAVNGEERIKIPSPDVPSYDKKPEMSASEITRTVINKIKKDQYDFYCLNYANPDMVGHTGNLKAGIVACSCVDQQIGKLWREVNAKRGIMVITADHGNAEEMINFKTGEIDTEHSINPVPLIITRKNLRLKTHGALCNVAPTILKLMDLPVLKLMSAKPLC